MKKSFTIHDLPLSERPRERLATLGSDALSLQELIALILGRGIPGEPVMVTAQKLLAHFGSLKNMQEASLDEIQQVKGIGLAKACQLQACFAIAHRLQKVDSTSLIKEKSKALLSPDAVYLVLKSKIAHFKKEHLIVISFDTRNKILGVDTVSIGTLNASLIHPRETFEVAIKRHAASIIISHNHPSGDPDPSDEDIKVTEKLVEAGKLLGIQVLDHIIVGKNEYYSFSNELSSR